MTDRQNVEINSSLASTQTCDPIKMEERSGYKNTKLGWIPEKWETPRIDEVFDFLSTNSLSRNQLNYEDEEGVFNIHYGDIHATYKQPILDFDNENRVPKINKDIVLSVNTDFLKDGDLVIADASEDYEGVGEAIELKNINGKKVTSGLHTFAFRDKTNKTAEDFRVYIFRNLLVKKALKTIATGSKVYGISKGNIQKFRIVLPPLPEQQKIATILSTWDNAIAKQQQLIVAKQKFKKGLMQLLLTGKKRFEGFEGDFKTSKLGDIFTIQGRVGWKGYKKEDLREEGPIVIGAKHVNNQLLNLSDPTYLSIEKYEESPEIMIKINDLLIVQRGSLGKIALIEEEIGKATINPSMAILRPKNDNISVKYIYYFLCSDFSQNLIMSETGSTGVPMISQKQIATFKMTYPSLIEQQKIASVLSAADKEIGLLQSELAQLQGQKRGLMQRLLTGAVRVKI
ncbi:restriction endonuclease subunit S [Aequorivita sp. F47161]|uniref:Restriction endonuclease subunit S n=1 Tax=Aequorivita vitellina TaxID=2874475 RepID=A0A9X1QZU0_9FLAO|nr:restriction endonuclease subunit S [Aequorivita vitellina]MCG2420088.1 restriction endonuclease subunit S [Aequorivita vitellina]